MARTDHSSIWKQLAILTGLAVVAFVAPVLDIYGKNPEVFVANRTSATELFMFAFVVGLVVPIVSSLVLWIASRIGVTTHTIAFRSLVGFLALATGLVVSRQIFADNTALAVVATLAIAVIVYWLAGTIEVVFVWAGLAIPVLIFMFVATSASARLIWEEPEESVAGVPIGSPEHLVMIQLDEMPLASIMTPGGTINGDLFPGFARLAGSGTWYRNAFSDSIATTQSVPAILTGKRGEKGLLPKYVDHPDNLFTLLADSHEMHVIEWVAELCPGEICPDYAGRAPARFVNLLADVGVVYGHLTLPERIRESLPSIGNAWKGFLGQGGTPAGNDIDIEGLPVPPNPARSDWINWIQRLINGIKSGTGPTLSYGHLRTPHVPWVANPSGTHYDRPEEYTEVYGVEGDGRWATDPAMSLVGFQRHLAQVGFLDTMLMRLVAHLEESGTWDDTMVVVVADHGASFTPGEHRRWPYEDNRVDLYRVPLIIKYPHQTEAEIVDFPAFGIDIVPTVVDVMDIETDWRFDGQSLLRLTDDRPHKPIRWCCNGDGVDTDLKSLFDQVQFNYSRVQDQSSWDAIAATGNFGELVGSPTSSLDLTSQNAFSWSLDLGASLDDVDHASGEVQTLVTGRLQSSTRFSSNELLIAVNEVVAGVAYLSRDSADGASFIGLLPESAISDGANDVEVFMTDGAGGWATGLSTDLNVTLKTPDGTEIDIGTEGGLRVQVDTIEMTDGIYRLVGWGADTTNKEPPGVVYIFAGEQLVASTEPNRDNGNVVVWFGSEDLRRSGFEMEIPADELPEGIDRVLVVAYFDGRAVADSVGLSRPVD